MKNLSHGVFISGALVLAAIALAPALFAKTPSSARAGQNSAETAGAPSDALPAGAVGRYGSARLREAGAVTWIEFSADGKLLVTGASGVVHVWKWPGGQELSHFSALPTKSQARFSPDGSMIAVLEPAPPPPGGGPPGGWGNPSPAGALVLHDLKTGAVLFRLAEKNVTTFAFSANAKRLVAGEITGGVSVYDTATGKPVAPLVDTGPNHQNINSVWQVAISPDGATAVSTHGNGVGAFLHVWDVATQKERLQTARLPGDCLDMSFSSDGKTLTTLYDPRAGGDSFEVISKLGVRSWSVAPGTEVSPAAAPATYGHDGVARLATAGFFSPNLKSYAFRRAAEKWDGAFHNDILQTLSVVDIGSGQVTAMEGKIHGATAAAFSPDGAVFVAGGIDGQIAVWDAATGKRADSADAITGALHGIAISPDGKYLAVGGDDQAIHLLEMAGGKSVGVLKGHENTVLGLAFSPDGASLASSSSDKTVRIWQLANGQSDSIALDRFSEYKQSTVAWSADGKFLAVTDGAQLHVIDVTARRVLKDSVGPSPVDFAAGLRFYASFDNNHPGNAEQSVHTLTGMTIKRVGGVWEPAVFPWNVAAASADGKQVAASRFDTLKLLDGPTFKELRTLEPRAQFQESREIKTFRHLAFTPNGAKLVAIQDAQPWNGSHGMMSDPNAMGTAEQFIRVYDTQSGNEVLHLKSGHRGAILAIAFANEGKWLLTASADSTVLAWDITQVQPAEPVPNDPSALWELVVGTDPDRAADAIKALAARPVDAVAATRAYLSFNTGETSAVSALLAETDDASFARRIAATKKLSELREQDPAVETALIRRFLDPAITGASKDRMAALLAGIGEAETPPRRQLARVTALLEQTNTPEARAQLERLATLPPLRGGIIAADALHRLENGTGRSVAGETANSSGKVSLPTTAPSAALPPTTAPSAVMPSTTAPSTALPPTTAPSTALPPQAPSTQPVVSAPGPTAKSAHPATPPPHTVIGVSEPKDTPGKIIPEQPVTTSLPPGATARYGTSLLRHARPIMALSFSSDGKPGESAAIIHLFDVDAKEEVGRFEGHNAQITAMEFSPGGDRMYTASNDGTILVWNVADAPPAIRPPGEDAPVKKTMRRPR